MLITITNRHPWRKNAELAIQHVTQRIEAMEKYERETDEVFLKSYRIDWWKAWYAPWRKRLTWEQVVERVNPKKAREAFSVRFPCTAFWFEKRTLRRIIPELNKAVEMLNTANTGEIQMTEEEMSRISYWSNPLRLEEELKP